MVSETKVSTSLALYKWIDEISHNLDNNLFSIEIFLDLSKAFDTINHELLLKKLYHYGIRGISHSFISSYLCNRKQYVYLDRYVSSMLNISCGIPQGSVLGPLLFILYVNDMSNVSQLVKCVLFADDTNIIYSSNTIDDVDMIINMELKKLHTWFQVNKLSLNVAKSNFITFRNRNVQHIPDIIISDHHIFRCKCWQNTILVCTSRTCLQKVIIYNIRFISGIIMS